MTPGDLRQRREIPVWPHFEEDEIQAVNRVLSSGKVNQWTGQEVSGFEKEFSSFMGSARGIAVSNGTVALEAALRALGVGPGDEVVVPSRTFVATASAVAVVGAKPVVADVDRESGNLTDETIRPRLSPRTKALIPVHMEGWPCEMDPIMELAEQEGFAVVEDCAQAHGASYKGRRVGTIGHVGCFSFCQDKIMSTAGEGGMILTDDDELATKIWSFKDHGKDPQEVKRKDHPPGFRWLHGSFGTNWRMTEIQAAVGRVQLKKLPDWLARRRENAAAVRSTLEGAEAIRLSTPPAHSEHSYYRFHFHLKPDRLQEGWDRDRLLGLLQERGEFAHVGTCSEIYREEAFKRAGYAPEERFPVARELHETSMMVPVHHRLEPTQAAEIALGIRKTIEEIGR